MSTLVIVAAVWSGLLLVATLAFMAMGRAARRADDLSLVAYTEAFDRRGRARARLRTQRTPRFTRS